jgi:hypothetical protein
VLLAAAAAPPSPERRRLSLRGNLLEIEFLQNLRLTQREASISVFVVERDDHVLDLLITDSPGQPNRTRARPMGQTNLVSPEKCVADTILEAIPDVQELFDPVLSHMIGMFLCFFPLECSSQRKQAHINDQELGRRWAESTVCRVWLCPGVLGTRLPRYGVGALPSKGACRRHRVRNECENDATTKLR